MSTFTTGDIIGMAVLGLFFGFIIGCVVCHYIFRKRVFNEIQNILEDIKYIRGYSQATIDRKNDATEETKKLRLEQDSTNESWQKGYKTGWSDYDLGVGDGHKEPKDMFNSFDGTYRFRSEFLSNSLFFM